jgi:hypothetical protein
VFKRDRLEGVQWKSGCFAQDAVADRRCVLQWIFRSRARGVSQSVVGEVRSDRQRKIYTDASQEKRALKKTARTRPSIKGRALMEHVKTFGA